MFGGMQSRGCSGALNVQCPTGNVQRPSGGSPEGCIAFVIGHSLLDIGHSDGCRGIRGASQITATLPYQLAAFLRYTTGNFSPCRISTGLTVTCFSTGCERVGRRRCSPASLPVLPMGIIHGAGGPAASRAGLANLRLPVAYGRPCGPGKTRQAYRGQGSEYRGA